MTRAALMLLPLTLLAGCPTSGRAGLDASLEGPDADRVAMDAEQPQGLDASAAPDAGLGEDAGLVWAIEIGSASLGPVNRRLLGNNVQWVDHADHLTNEQGAILPDRLATLQAMGVPLLRYPGGTLSDAFRFTDSIEPLASRPLGLDLQGVAQPMALGTNEYMSLCKQLGAEPLITLNLYSGTPLDATAWLSYLNLTEGPQRGWPKAVYWEIGNEPYLTTSAPGYGPDELTPAEFSRRANETLRALRAVDPTLKLALPVRLDSMNGTPTVTKPGFLDTVLELVTEPFELAAIHDGYLPVDLGDTASDPDLFLATMAGPLAFEEELRRYRARLDEAKPGNAVRFALTEYHPWLKIRTMLLYATNPDFTMEELIEAVDADHRANSLAGAIYVADLLRLLSYRSDVELAAFWSASGNYVFGALNDQGVPRPPALALQAAGEVLRGELLPVSGATPTLSTPNVGLVRAFSAVPTLTTLAAREGTTVRLLIAHKHPSDAIRVSLPGIALQGATARVLTAADALSRDDSRAWLQWQPLPIVNGRLDLPPHSLVRIDAPQP
ncbi:MAG: hypothetical protein HY901_23550 [Deltaproteobacteria bacterium]|nr:hypothetical protein [Deltaproteobacteria bacterium]